MIKLKKGPKPKILINNAERWTEEYCECLDNNEKPSSTVANRYNCPEIKDALEDETHGKCAYCESYIKHISYGDIEHILPKNKDARPDLYVTWSNLTLSCEICNRSGKGTYYNTKIPLINPYIDNPEDHFVEMKALIKEIPGDQRAKTTIETLRLNRAGLIERRKERIDSIKMLLDLWKTLNEPKSDREKDMKEKLENQLRKEVAEDKEYISTVKFFLLDNDFPLYA